MAEPQSALEIRDVIRQHHATIYRYAYRLAGCSADADDVCQQTFLIAHQRLSQVRHVDRVDRWLMAVARSCFLKSKRVRRGALACDLEFDMALVPEPPVAGQEIDRELLASALADLAEDFRVVLLMFYFEELSYAEISAQLEVPIGTVMSRLSRAKSHLRNKIVAAECGAAVANGLSRNPTQPGVSVTHSDHSNAPLERNPA